MKRKLIAIALACAMVFSMIPSLAFADVAVEVPTAYSIMDAVDALDAYDKVTTDTANDFGKMELKDYEAVGKAIEAVKADYELLEAIATEGDGDDDYPKATKEAAVKELKRVAAGYADAAKTDLGTAYKEQVRLLVAEDFEDLEASPAQIYANKNGELAAVKAVIPGLVKALKDTEAAAPAGLGDVEVVIFAKAVESDLGYAAERVAAGHEASAPAKAIMEGVAATYPAFGDVGTIGNYVTENTSGELLGWYTTSVDEYNAANYKAINRALAAVVALDSEDAAEYAGCVEVARNAFDALIENGDETSKSGIEGSVLELEAGYVELLLDDAVTESAKVDADAIAATEAARVAYDKLYDFYDENGYDMTELNAVKTGLLEAEAAVDAYYYDTVTSKYTKVKDVEKVTAENKADVEAFVNAWDGYYASLTYADKEAIADGTDKAKKLYADKAAALKTALEAFEAEEAAKEEQAAQEQADLEAKVAIMGTKVAKVAAKAGKNKATITWKKNKNADGYKVMRATSKNGKFKAVKKNTTKVKFVNKKLKSGKTYFYKVVAYKTIAGKKVWSKDSKIVKVKVK